MDMSLDNQDNPDNTSITQEIESLIPTLQQFIDCSPESQAYRLLADGVARELKTVAKRGESYSEARRVIESYQHLTTLWGSALGEMLTNLERLEQASIRREKYSLRWWEQTSQTLQQAFDKDREAAYKQWMVIYAQALVDWELETCSRLVSATFSHPRDKYPYALLIRDGNASLQDQDYPAALAMLKYLVNQLSEATAEDLRLLGALLSIFIGRIHLFQMNEPKLARQAFNRAEALAPRDGRPKAALGHIALGQGDLAEANRLSSRAVEFSPDQPEGYVGKAMVAEYRELWNEADEWYKKALNKSLTERDIFQSLSKMLAPGSGRLYLHVAHQLLADDAPDHALVAIEHCLDLGMQDNSDYPTRSAIALKADILLSISSSERTPEEARSIADLYLEAGNAYSWNNEFQIAVDLLKKGRDLDSGNARIIFSLADTLRALNYKPTQPHYVSGELGRESLAVWEEGIALGEVIDPDMAWIFMARSAIADQLALIPEEDEGEYYWQAILFDEQALLLWEYPEWWNALSSDYGRLSLYANMLQASRKYKKMGPVNISALEARIRALIFTGQYKSAAIDLNKLYTLAKPEDMGRYKFLGAQMNYMSGNYKQALEDINSSLDQEPDDLDLNNKYWRALIYHSMGKNQAAREDAQWLLEKLGNPYYEKEYNLFAWVTFLLGMFEETTHRVEPLLVSTRAEDRLDARLLSGLSFLALGDIKLADRHLSQALNECDDPSLLETEFIRELVLLQQWASLEGWSQSASISTYLCQPGGILELAKSKLKKTKRYRADPIKELEKVLSNPLTEKPGSWSWLAAQAGLGRLHLEADHLEAAMHAYEELSLYPQQMPAANFGLKKVQKRRS